MVGVLLFRNCILLALFLTSCQIFATTTTTVTKEVEKSVNASVEAEVISQPVETGEDFTQETAVDTLSKSTSVEKNATIEVEIISQPVLPDKDYTEEDDTLSKSVSVEKNTTVEVEALSQSVWSHQSASLDIDSYAQAVLTDQGIRYRPAHRGFSESDYGYESSSFGERGVYSNMGRRAGFDRWLYKLRDFNPAHVRTRPKGFSLHRYGPGRLPSYFENYPPIRKLGQPTNSFQDYPPTIPQPLGPLSFDGRPTGGFQNYPPTTPQPLGPLPFNDRPTGGFQNNPPTAPQPLGPLPFNDRLTGGYQYYPPTTPRPFPFNGQPATGFEKLPPTVPQPFGPLSFTGQPPRSSDDFPPSVLRPFPRPPRIVNRPKFVNSEFPFTLPPREVGPALGGVGSLPPLAPTPSLSDCPDLPKYPSSNLPPVSVSPLQTTGLSNYPPLCVPSTGLPGYSGPSALLPYSYSSLLPSASDCLTLLSSVLFYGMTSSLPAPQPVLCSPSFGTPPSSGLTSSLESSVLVTQSILC